MSDRDGSDFIYCISSVARGGTRAVAPPALFRQTKSAGTSITFVGTVILSFADLVCFCNTKINKLPLLNLSV